MQNAASGSSYTNIGSAGSDGLPNLKGPNKKEQKAMMQRLTVYNYNMAIAGNGNSTAPTN